MSQVKPIGGKTSARYDELLDAAVDHVLAEGLPNLSVRTVASALGVAHNTITHHFGDRAALQYAIFSRLAERTRIRTSAALPDGDPALAGADAEARMRAVWGRLSGAEYRTVWVAFFEAFAQAVREPVVYQQFLAHFINDWIGPLADEMQYAGASESEARARATLLVASMRGLILDKLAAPDDSARTDTAFEQLLTTMLGWLESTSGG